MFESFMAVPLHFTIEFLGFLVAAGGAILALTRRSLIPGEASNRITAAFGFVALALAQILHGGSFRIGLYSFESDGGEQLLIAARAVGLAFIFVGVSGGLRGGGTSVGAVFAVKQPLLFAPAGAAILLAGTAFAGSFKNGPRAFRRLALAAALLAVSEILTAFDPNAHFGEGVVSTTAFAAHAIKLGAYVAMSAWLWSAVRSSIRTRFVASFAALLVMVVLALSSTLTGVLTNNVEEEKLGELQEQLANQVETLGRETAELANDVEVVTALRDTVQVPVANGGNLDGLASDILTELEFLEFDFVMIMDPRGRILGFDGPDSLQRIDVVKIAGAEVVREVANRGQPVSASPTQIGRRIVANIAARQVAHPDESNRSAGIIAAGRFIDRLDVERISNQLAVEASLVSLDGRIIATCLGAGECQDWARLPRRVRDIRVVPGDVQTQVSALDQPIAARQTLRGEAYFSAFARLDSEGGGPVATVVLSSRAGSIAATREALTRILFLVALAVGAIALLLAYFSGRRITRPIQSLTQTAGAVREGDLTAQAKVSGDDEVGRLGETFNEMTSSLLKMTDDLRGAAREEQQLRARIETIIQSMADGLVATDAQHKVLAFNREAELLTGLKARHALGKPVDKVLQACDANGERVPLPIFDLAAGSVDNIFLEKKNRQRVPVVVVSAVLTAEEGDIAGGVAVLRDMTREREVERMKSEFLANISHELRTPLTPIKGYAEILGRKEVPPDKVKKFVGGILEGTARLERIIQLLVDFSAMEAGRLAPRSKPIDLGEIVQGLADDWEKKTPNHSVVAEITDALPRVSGDERLLRRSLEEVLDNAVKFSPRGGTIKLHARGTGNGNGDRRQEHVEVTVSDEGIGIPPEDIGKIFSDFHQLDGSETRSFGGLGLGLAFVQRIVEAHDGAVSVESELDQGTRLTISIPAAPRPRSRKARSTAAEPSGAAPAPAEAEAAQEAEAAHEDEAQGQEAQGEAGEATVVAGPQK